MSETMVETCVLSLGELIDRKLQNDKKLDKNQCKTICEYFVCGGDKADKQYQLTIPFYQRAYVWDKERVKILLEDLDEYLDMKSNKNKPNTYLLGSLILYKNNDTNEFEVVDGQQRLVSLALILRVLNDSDSSEFLGKSEFAHSESKKHIKENYDFIVSWFSSKKGWKIEESEKHKKDDIQKYGELLKNKIEFVCVFTNNLDNAFIFFDSANAKGMRLEAYDLIKAFHLRALETQNCNDLIKIYAKDFESFVKKSDNDDDNGDDKNRPIKVLLNDILAPARIWLRDRGKLANAIHKVITNPQEHYIYDEFCKEFSATLQTKPQRSTNSLGILQNFIGGVDFFEFLAHFNRLYEKLLQTEFYDKKIANINETGFKLNGYIYIMAMLIYFDKFPNGNADYMLRLIARAIFSLRVAESRIGEATIKKYAKEQKILSLIYHTSIEQELESELLKFVWDRISIEDKNKDNITNATKLYLEQVQGFDDNKNEQKIPYKKTEYGRYGITPHPEPTK